MSNSKFQQAREAMLTLMGEVTASWTEEEKREMVSTVNAAFFTGALKPHPLTQARLDGAPVENSRRAGRQ